MCPFHDILCRETHCALRTHHQSSDAIYSNQTLQDTLTAAASAHQPPFSRRYSDIPAQTTQHSAFLRVALGSASHHGPLFTLGDAHTRFLLWHSLATCLRQVRRRVTAHVRQAHLRSSGGCGTGEAVRHAATSAPRPLVDSFLVWERRWGSGYSRLILPAAPLCLSSAPRLHLESVGALASRHGRSTDRQKWVCT